MKPLATQSLEMIGKDWSVGSKTRNAHIQHTKDFANFVDKKFGLEKIQNLKPKHVESYVQDLRSRNLDHGTMCNRMAAVRTLAEAIGKGNIVAKTNKAYGINRGNRQNPIIANQAKIDSIRFAIVDLANSGNRVAMMCHAAAELREAFGLRTQESLMSSKFVDTPKGVALQVEGAKGGRPRLLHIGNAAQLYVAQVVAQVSQALGSGTGRVMPPELTLSEAYNKQRTLWRELGGTKDSRAHMYAARHSMAQTMKAQGYSKEEIMAWLGHGEGRSPFCYIPK